MDEIQKSKLPLRRSLTLQERVTIAVSTDMKMSLEQLRASGVDHSEWLRRIIQRELPAALADAKRTG